MNLERESYDVVIVGAGPAGSSLAIRLATSGLRVALVEQKKFPRHKLCGEFVSPECREHFAELGLGETINAIQTADLIETVFHTLSGRSVSVRSDVFGGGNAAAIGLSRARMDDMLLGRAHGVGVAVFEATSFTGLLINVGSVTGVELRDANGGQFKLAARLVIDATGRSRQLVRKISLTKIDRPKLTAFKTHLSGANPTPRVCEIYSYPAGYGGLNSVGDVFNLCFIVGSEHVRELGNDPEILMRRLVMQNPRAAKTLAEAEVAAPWLAVAIDRFGTVEPAPANGLIAIGDAASFIDPFTGSGILMALESSRVAAESILRNLNDSARLKNEYVAAYREKFAKRLRYSNLLRYASTSTRVAEFAVAALGSSEFLRSRVALFTRR